MKLKHVSFFLLLSISTANFSMEMEIDGPIRSRDSIIITASITEQIPKDDLLTTIETVIEIEKYLEHPIYYAIRQKSGRVITGTPGLTTKHGGGGPTILITPESKEEITSPRKELILFLIDKIETTERNSE